MELVNEFTVPLPPEQAWDVLLDIPRVAPCVPGASLTEVVDDKTYKGQVSVKIGPLALVFSGNAQLQEVDAVNRTARVKAQGHDTKGRGNASAIVTFKLLPAAEGSLVSVKTDLNLSGSVAQYGRGVGIIQAVAAELTRTFARNLQGEIEKSQPPAGAAATDTAAAQPAGATSQQNPVAISGFSLLLRSLWNMLWPGKSSTTQR